MPVKLFLDRKEEHLDTGNRPSASAKIRAGVSADGKLTAFDATELGHGRCGRGVRFPAAVHLPVPEPPARAHRRLHQRGPAARDARAGPPAGVLPHRNPDGRARRSRPHGSGRVPHQEPADGGAERGLGRLLPRRARRRSAGTSATPTGDPTPGPIKNGFGVSAHQWGGGGRGGRAHCDITSDGSVVMKCGTQDLGTGTRTIVAMLAAETLGLPVSAVKPEIGDTMYPVCGASGGSTTAASISPAIRIAAGKALDGCSRRWRRSSASAPTCWSPTSGRIHVKGNTVQGHDAGRTPAS